VQTALSFGEFVRQQRLGLNRRASHLGSYERLPARIGRAITQEEVAEAVGGSRNWYALLELDARRTSATLANRLADVFNLEGTEKLKLVSLAVPGLVLHCAGVTDPAGSVLEDWAPRPI
jgi:DNA-binding XRE family transcriptional regulator